jgi:septal ring factor EnvC (AmiA/AmiB activator)
MAQQQHLESEITNLTATLANLEAEVRRLSSDRENSEKGDDLDSGIESLEAQSRGISWTYESLNPLAIRHPQRQALIARTSANGWTDTIFAIKSWCTNHFSLTFNVPGRPM